MPLDRDKTAEDWLAIMEKIDEGDTEKWDEAKDKNEGINFEEIDLTFKPGFLEAFFAPD
uniref:Uncharacterized protein n=1 Tax=uncultured bacterium contig00097 TaxID=1181566 RepID=A0A806K1E9_9BACT|nr:hypothetical protein [uncultured bacterium contig00097]